VQLTYKGYVKGLEPNSKSLNVDLQDDVAIASYETRSDRQMVVLTNSGKALPLALGNIPIVKGKGRGTPLITLLPDSDRPVAQFVWDKNSESTAGLVLLSSQGKIKRSPLAEFADMTARGLIAAKFKEGDALFWADVVDLDKELAIATSAGRILRFKADQQQIPTVGRAATGNIALRLGSNESQVGVAVLDLLNYPNSELLLVTVEGCAKRIRAANIRAAMTGAIGAQCFKFLSRTDSLVSVTAIAQPRPDLAITILIGQENNIGLRTVTMPLGAVSLELANSQGRSILAGANDLGKTEKVLYVTYPYSA
jgi:DNA gyrase subunit A